MNPIVKAVIGPALDTVDKVLGRFFASKDDRQKAMLEIQAELTKQEGELQAKVMDLQAAQVEVNKIEAQSASLFVAGWRPAAGWVCSISLAALYIPKALVLTSVWVYQCYTVFSAWNGLGIAPSMPAFPDLGVTDVIGLLGSMLGLAGVRTIEKIKGEVDRSSLKEP